MDASAYAFAHGIRQIQLNEARNDPSRNRDGLIAGLRGSGLRGARGFSGRARGNAPDQEPIFFLSFQRFAGILFIGGLHPLGYAASHNFDGNIARKLVETRFSASGKHAQIRGHFGAAARLHGHVADLFEQLDAALPEGRLH